jgi:hypothetical protein
MVWNDVLIFTAGLFLGWVLGEVIEPVKVVCKECRGAYWTFKSRDNITSRREMRGDEIH